MAIEGRKRIVVGMLSFAFSAELSRNMIYVLTTVHLRNSFCPIATRMDRAMVVPRIPTTKAPAVCIADEGLSVGAPSSAHVVGDIVGQALRWGDREVRQVGQCSLCIGRWKRFRDKPQVRLEKWLFLRNFTSF